ncbi:MAG: hypothetical protein ACRDFX_02955 [Chloroflexota bacterium]
MSDKREDSEAEKRSQPTGDDTKSRDELVAPHDADEAVQQAEEEAREDLTATAG